MAVAVASGLGSGDGLWLWQLAGGCCRMLWLVGGENRWETGRR